MTSIDLKILIQEGEGTALEFKENLSTSFARELVPKGMKLSDLGHKSIRRSALIADLLHRIEFIEKAGTGIKRIRDEAKSQGCPEPRFEETGFFTVIFYPNPEVRAQSAAQSAGATGQVLPKYPPSTQQAEAHDEAHDEAHEPISDIERRLLAACTDEPRSTPDLLSALGYKTRTGNFKIALRHVLTRGFLVMSVLDKPRSKHQRYRITALGLEVLTKTKELK